jgi:hypothetical protein
MIHPVTMNSRYRVGYGSERESYTVAKLMLRKQGAYGEVYFVCGGGECKEDALDTLGKGVLRIYLHYSFDVHHSGNYGVFQFDNQVLEA